MSSDLDEQLATLAREQGRLETLLKIDENWRALAQLDAREARGEALVSVDGAALRARLLDSLKYNRLYQARIKILEAIAILTETAALPTYAIPPSTSAEVEAKTDETVEPEPAEATPEPESIPAPAPDAAEPLQLPAAGAQAAPVEPIALSDDSKQEHVAPPPPEPISEPEPEPPSGEIHAEPVHVEPPPTQSDPRRTPLRATIHTAPPVSLEARPAADPALAAELLQIRGITPALAARLQSLGVGHAGDIAIWTKDDVNSFSSALGLGRAISRENWIEQAALIVQRSGRTLPARQPAAQPAALPAPPVAAEPNIPEPVPAEPPTAEPQAAEPVNTDPLTPEPAPQKPTPTPVATIVAGAARSIAERIERLRESEDTAPSEPDDRPARPMIVERARDITGAAPARHTPADYVSILSRVSEASVTASDPEPAAEAEHRPDANVEPDPPSQPEVALSAIETATAQVVEPQAPEAPPPAIATFLPADERESPPEPEATPAEPEPPAAQVAPAPLPADIEDRLNRLERDAELSPTDEVDVAAAAPAQMPGALNGNTIEHPATQALGQSPPAASDVGTVIDAPPVSPTEPEPHLDIGAEAEIEFTRRREPSFTAAGAHPGNAPPLPSSAWTGDPDPPQGFDANDYDAYRGQSEEASVEIVRGNSAARTRLPAKPRPNNQQSQETTAAVRRFLDALRGR